jgi:hypothetical protein
MDFPVYRMLLAAPNTGRGPFSTCQYFMFLSEREAINVRLDNVVSIGYAEEMPASTAAMMLRDWKQIDAERFNDAFWDARRKIGLRIEMFATGL